MSSNPPGDPRDAESLGSGWQAVVDDMSTTAQAYREDGWTTLELHPGDSVLVDSEARTGLDVLLPGPEYDELEAVTEDAVFTDVDVFRAESDGLLYLLVVEQSPDTETAVFVPAYYDPGGSRDKLDSIRDDGEFRLFCRQLTDEYVLFVHDDVEPFSPEALGDG